jgi:hypothetical protein
MPQSNLYNKLRICSVLLLLALLSALSGCITEQERRGYSDLPQNRPAAWESRPYGETRM